MCVTLSLLLLQFSFVVVVAVVVALVWGSANTATKRKNDLNINWYGT